MYKTDFEISSYIESYPKNNNAMPNIELLNFYEHAVSLINGSNLLGSSLLFIIRVICYLDLNLDVVRFHGLNHFSNRS